MSGFFGVFSPGGNLDQVPFDQMKSAIYRNNYDELETYIDDTIAMGHLMLRVNLESVYDKQPLKSDCGRYIVVGHFRLDYRDELGDKLGLTQKELEQAPDSFLVMKSYQKWGEKCVHHLEGDWAFAVYDMLYQVIFFAKDPTGISALFYTIHNRSLYFSSDPSVFSNSEFFPLILDETQLLYYSVEGLKIDKGSTLFKNLKCLRNGFILSVTSSLMESMYPFFDLSSIKIQKNYLYDSDVALDFKSIYFNAVKSRCRSKHEIGLFLSAGLDSMSVAAVSSRELKKVDRKLNTFTSVPSLNSKLTDKEKQFADESSLVQIFNSSRDNLQSRYLSFDDFELSKINLNELRKDPFNPSVTLNSFWMNGVLKEAHQSGIRLMMTGQMGNFAVSADGYLVHIEMLIRLQFFKLYEEIRHYAFNKKVSFLSAFFMRVVRVFKFNLNCWIKKRSLFSDEFFSINGSFSLGYYKKFKNLFKLKSRELITGYSFFLINRELRIKQLEKNLYFANIYWSLLGNSSGVDITDPTSDKRVIDFSLTISDIYFYRKGEIKYLYKKMFRELLPREILENTNSMIQSFDFGDRIKTDVGLLSFVKSLQSISSEKDVKMQANIVDMLNNLCSEKHPNYNRKELMRFLHNVSVFNFLVNFK
jgi:asparagine synthase (glutamine-hydrolysing)